MRMLQTYKEGTSVLWGLPGPRLRCPHGTSVLGLKCHRVPQSWSTSVPFYKFQHAWTKSFLVQGWNSRCTSCKLGVVPLSHQPSITSNWTWYPHQIWYPPSTLVTPFPISHGTSWSNLVHTPIRYSTPSPIRPLTFGWLHPVIKLFFLLVFIGGEAHAFSAERYWHVYTLYIILK